MLKFDLAHSHSSHSLSARHQIRAEIRYENRTKVFTDVPHLYAKYEPEYNVFVVVVVVVERFKQKRPKRSRKSAAENPFIKILQDDYEAAYKIRRRRRWLWRWSRANGQMCGAPYDQVNSIDWNSL